MNESTDKIIWHYERLTDKEKKQIITVLSKHFGKPIQISTSFLSMYSKDEIKIISNILHGLILTKENVPDIRETYERVKGMDLPQKISFGHLKNSGKSTKISIFGLVASVGCIIMCAIFLYWNPYSSTPSNDGTIITFYTMLILPAFIGIIASCLKNRILMYIVFVWSLPCGLYLSIVSIPSIWNLYGAILILYLVSAILMKKTASI